MEPTTRPPVPPYFDFLIEGFRRGESGRFVHLGHWDEPPEGPGLEAQEFARAQARLNQHLLAMAGLGDQQRIIDVGCGFGGTLAAIDDHHNGMRLVGANIDPRQLEICRELRARPGNTFEWREADACDLPFPDQSFDRVLCIEALFHFTSRRRFFREASRLLCPGGTLVLSDMFLTDQVHDLEVPGMCIEAPIADGYGPWPDFWGEDANHRALAAAAGLQTVSIVDATRATLPSHQFTAPSDPDERHDSGNPMVRAALMLRWLHRNGYLRYAYMRFDKPA